LEIARLQHSIRIQNEAMHCHQPARITIAFFRRRPSVDFTRWSDRSRRRPASLLQPQALAMERGSHRDLRQHLGRRPYSGKPQWRAHCRPHLGRPSIRRIEPLYSDRAFPKLNGLVVNKRFRPLFGVLHSVAKQVYPAKEISKLERRPQDADAGRRVASARNHQQQDEQRSLFEPATWN
jgi:hypothetical protein